MRCAFSPSLTSLGSNVDRLSKMEDLRGGSAALVGEAPVAVVPAAAAAAAAVAVRAGLCCCDAACTDVMSSRA